MKQIKLDKRDLNNLASFFDEYLQDMEIEKDDPLDKTVNKIFNITKWFSDE